MNRIRELREKHNLTQKALGELMGYSESTCSLYESGKRQPDTKTLVFLANYFNVSVDYILGRKDEKESPADEADRARKEVVDILIDLSPDEVQRVCDFISGLKASRVE